MQAGASFADVLDAHLGCTSLPPVRPALSNRPLTSALFVFDMPMAAAAARPAAAPRREPSRPSTPAIALTALEKRALTALNTLGADLDEHLSIDTLRRAFRQLAHRYHPDRHPGTSAAEHARLARLFADVTGHYRLLAASLESRLQPRG
jgi:hypothetical protein